MGSNNDKSALGTDDPPAYADVATANSSSSFSVPLPPKNSQKAEAPLLIQHSNTSIQGNFTIICGKESPEQVVTLTTKNAQINTTLWIAGEWARPVTVSATTTNSPIHLTVIPLVSSQPVDVVAKSTNAQIDARLAQSFHGHLIIGDGSKHTLSPELQARSVRVTLPDLDSKAAAYRIGGEGGKSKAVLNTTYGSVSAGFA